MRKHLRFAFFADRRSETYVVSLASGVKMQVLKAVGRDAAARKYDLLSAIMAHGLAGDQNCQRLILRLMSLITSRYNWTRNELVMGQREIAKLWCVDERTVKRDMARFRELGWVVIKRKGVRGRVSVLALDIERILLDTQHAWGNIGEDYIARMGGDVDKTGLANVVPFRKIENTGDLWSKMCSQLQAEDASLFQAWFESLAFVEIENATVHLLAPSKFHANYIRTHFLGRLRMAARRSDHTLQDIVVFP